MREFTISQDDKRIILTLSPSRTYRENTLQMIRAIQKENLQIILICVNQPAAFLMDFYQRNGIDTRGIFFIDAITQYAIGSPGESTDNCVFVSRPNNLTAIGMILLKPWRMPNWTKISGGAANSFAIDWE